MATSTTDERLRAAWEKARKLPDFRKAELVDFIDFLESRADADDIWEPDEEEAEALRAFFAGEEEPGIPLGKVAQESEELGENVLD